MSKQNAYLQKRDAERQALVTAAMDTGFQKCWDLVILVLNDKKIMGKDTFGKARLMRIYKALQVIEKEYGDAWCDTVDADYLQEKLDAHLREIFGADGDGFSIRYPYIKETDYSHGKKKWR